MLIIDRAGVKTNIGIAASDTSRDAEIDSLLPAAQRLLFEVTSNTFEKFLDEIVIEADTISFDSANKKILDSGSGFVDAGFVDGMIIRVSGSLFNDADVLKVTTVAAGSLALDAAETLTAEAAGRTIQITFVSIPEEAKLFISKLIGYYLSNKANREGVESERFDDYSVKYSLKREDIPESVVSIIKSFIKLKWD